MLSKFHLGRRIVNAIEARSARKQMTADGPLGDFYRAGGNAQLYDRLPLYEDDIVIDGGGFRGEWTARILARYACKSEIFEPTPLLAAHCKEYYQHNPRVKVHEAALGKSNITARFNLAENATSQFNERVGSGTFEARVVGIEDFISSLDTSGTTRSPHETVGVLKLNIEGGEYEVLESLLASGTIKRIRCLLIQFHRQPDGWEKRYERIRQSLKSTHEETWCYPLVWERWDKRQ